jgi:hypothetical protein
MRSAYFSKPKESNLELTADQTARLDSALQIGTTIEAAPT